MPSNPNHFHGSRATETATQARRVAAGYLRIQEAAVLLEPLAGGFSGGAAFRVQLSSGPACGGVWLVKAFPPGYDLRRAEWVHRILRHASGSGSIVPRPVEHPGGGSVFVAADGRHWEMLSWIEGRPRLRPRPAEVIAAIQAVAAVHRAVADLTALPPAGPPPAAVYRPQRAAAILADPWPARLERAGGIWRQLAAAEAAMRPLVEQAVRRIAEDPPALKVRQVVLRDCTAEHVLFADETSPGKPSRVVGLIDYHAAGFDSVACDLARLLGDWELGLPEAAGHADALDAYAAAAGYRGGLSSDEREAVGWLHASGVVLGLDNWLRWVVEERREFARPAAVVSRIERLLGRLGPAVRFLAAAPRRGIARGTPD
jgi:Ser/Thr protein kinase RdoA (MazF antagonist)